MSKIEALTSLPERLGQYNIERLSIEECDSLLFIAKNTLPSSLKGLWILDCKKLQHLEGISSTRLEFLVIEGCKSLTCLSLQGSLPGTLEFLVIDSCENLTTLSSSGCMHEKLEDLCIQGCPKLKSIEEVIHNSPRLKSIDSTVSLPIKDIPTSLSNLHIMGNVETSKALVKWGLYKFTSLKSLSINGFEGLELSLQEDQRLPLSLESLAISNLASFRSISHLDTLTSLKSLDIQDSNFNSIPDLASHSSLEELHITNCAELKSVVRLRNLTSLHTLVISECRHLKSLPKPPPSLLELEIKNCPSLKKHWRRGKGKYSSKIAHIPRVEIDGKFIFNSKEEELS